jgi:urease accessory protein
MIASASAHVRPGGVLGAVTSQPPLTLRQVHADEADICALCLVGSAAGPLAGDDYRLHLEVEDQARASLRAAGASIAQGRGGRSSSIRLSARVGAGASLDADPGALIVCEGSRVDVSVELRLAADARLQWRETVVLGRTGDAAPGAATISWDVRRADRALLRQRVDLSDPLWGDWLLAGHRVLSSVLLVGPEVHARTVVLTSSAVAQRIDEHAVLITVLAADGAQATAQLDELVQAFPRTPAYSA